MINKTAEIEDFFENLLSGNTLAAENIQFNAFDIILGDQNQGVYINGIHIADERVSHDEHSSSYLLRAEYVFECLNVSKNVDTIFTISRTLANQLQQILLNNPAAPNKYFDLKFMSAQRILERDRLIPLAGYALKFELNYFGQIIN